MGKWKKDQCSGQGDRHGGQAKGTAAGTRKKQSIARDMPLKRKNVSAYEKSPQGANRDPRRMGDPLEAAEDDATQDFRRKRNQLMSAHQQRQKQAASKRLMEDWSKSLLRRHAKGGLWVGAALTWNREEWADGVGNDCSMRCIDPAISEAQQQTD